MPGYVPNIAELESALKQLHDPDLLRASPLATLDLVHDRVAPDQRVSEPSAPPLPWIYGYELAALLRERIDRLRLETTALASQGGQRTATRPQLYAQILQLRYVEDRSWNEVAEAVGLAAGHIQSKVKRPAIQRLLGDLLDRRETIVLLDAPIERSYMTNLPPPGEFIGRRAEIEGVLAKLRRRRMPIIEISGIGGVGKSALAKHIGWRALEENLVDAVIWLSAKEHHLAISGTRPASTRASLHSLNDLFETIARILGASQVPLEPDARRRQVLDMLTSGRFPHGVLIIIDNYETLRIDEQERIVSFLFEELPYPSQALITSRHEEHLLVVQSHVLPIKVHLDRMSVEDAAACLDYFLSLQSPPTVTSNPIKEQIIALSNQIPLAMLWLLGQLRYSPRSQIETLEDLRTRQDGVNALISYIFDHSYNLLGDQPDTRAVLHALTAFVEPVLFAPLAATAALPLPRVEQALLLLQQLSLVTREGDQPRYGLLELTRSYVDKHLSEEQRRQLLGRAAKYYVDYGAGGERANVTPLLEWAIKDGQHTLVVGLFDVLTAAQFVESDTQVQDCAAYGADVVQAARVLGQERRADWYEIFAVCWPMVVRGELMTARLALERLLDRAQHHGWQDNRALASSTLGLLFNDLGEAASGEAATALYETAATFLRQAAALWEDLQRPDWLAVVMGRLGTVARQLGDYERALDYYTWTAALYDTMGNQAGRASVLGRCGYTLLQRYRARGQGDPQEIERLLVEALQLSERLGNRWGVAANSLRYAEFLELQHELDRARVYAERARALFTLIPEPHRTRQSEEIIARIQVSYRWLDRSG